MLFRSGVVSPDKFPTKPYRHPHPDLTGEKRGSLTCVGYNGDGRWVMLCRCGLYTVRKTETIRRKNHEDMCPQCRDEFDDWKKEFFKEHGRPPEYWERPLEIAGG